MVKEKSIKTVNNGKPKEHAIKKESLKKTRAKKASTSNVEGVSKQEIQKENIKKTFAEKIAGFIFMCNGRTKPECYRHRVFGLPLGKLEVVEKIVDGSKLFLFDTDSKLLYGIYKAMGSGGKDLERSAFGGKFPAQVRFKILKDCLPVPESVFKHAIQENYDSPFRFKSELTKKQVGKLFSLFQPIPAEPASPAVDRRPAIASHRKIHGPPVTHYAPPVVEPRHVPVAAMPPPSDAYYLADAPPVMETRRLPAADPYFRQSILAENHSVPEHDLYRRHVILPEVLPRERREGVVADPRLLHPEREGMARVPADRLDEYLALRAARRAGVDPPPQAGYVKLGYEEASRAGYVRRAYDDLPQAVYVRPVYEEASHAGYVRHAYDDSERVYADAYARPASGVVSTSSMPVSSLYSFAGALQSRSLNH